MRLLRTEKTEEYHEIEVEYTFLWVFKYRTTYRMIGANNRYAVMAFESPDKYYEIGISEYIKIHGLFNAKLPTI
jgi:hypothetical protein